MIHLTGRTRFRDSKGKLIFQVQVCKRVFDAGGQTVTLPGTWRDAKTEDLAELHSLSFSQINVWLPQLADKMADKLPGEEPIPPKKEQH